ncbi:sugar kinase [Bacillus sp. Marseille-P3800]|uniref:sugar kinase n=1 Tax=Bacillus sp. Marseille-P3800 TaxID=2014782 RepID=UPI000C087000|nr:sugar kinase [Bacillus sp. Marseille-P3800]
MGTILSFGEVMMRLEPPDYRTLAQSDQLSYSFSGTGMNVLSGLSQFGHSTALLTVLPENNLGRAASSAIRSLGIQTNALAFKGDYLGMYILERGFGQRASEVTYSNRIESSFCQSNLADYATDCFDDATHIHFCGISLAVSTHTREMTLTMAKRAKAAGLTISFDCNYRAKLWKGGYEEAKPAYEDMLSLADIVFMNEQDARLILGLETQRLSRSEQVEELLPQVAKLYSISFIAGTLRNSLTTHEQTIQGFLVDENQALFSNVQTLTILDRIGGGDGFVSGMLHGLFSKKDYQAMIEFATAAGVLAHTTYGDSPRSTRQQVERFLRSPLQDLER